MKKLFISLVMAFGLVAVTSGCGETATNGNAEKTEDVKTEQAESTTSFESTTVTTSKGTYNIEMVMKRMYKSGYKTGKDKKAIHDKSPNQNPKSKLLQLAENSFKEDWKIYYGEPNNDEAKAVYEKALQKYLQGWEDGWGVSSTTTDSI